jgi:DNA-binding response OmpR family regulator
MKPLKVLIIEDNKITNALYEQALPDEVFEKVFAQDGKTGLELYKSGHPDILILDIGLPAISGFSILKKIRKEFDDKNTVIIMATAQTEKKDIIECAQFGIQGYILKPLILPNIAEQILDYFANLYPESAAEFQQILKKCNELNDPGKNTD